MDIYIKPQKKTSISGRSHIRVGDVCEVYAPADLRERVEQLKLLPADDVKKRIYLVSAIDVIKVIDQAFPGYSVNNVGEMNAIVEYHNAEKKDRPVWKWIKVCVISLIFAVGASSAIISFHNDAEVPKIFQTYYRIFTGKVQEKPKVIEISYAIGLSLGIIVFFNHIGGKRITGDPSPIEIEMSDYDNTVTETLIDFLSVKKAKKGGGTDGTP